MKIIDRLVNLGYWILRTILIIALGPKRFVARNANTLVQELRKVAGAHYEMAIILGTGWGDTLKLDGEVSVPLSRFWFLRGLENLHGHDRRICFGTVNGRRVIALRGRIHLNEEFSTPGATLMWRTVIEALQLLGAKTLITTAAVGALGDRAAVGNIVVVDGFFAPPSLHLGLFTGEFCAPDAILEKELRAYALKSIQQHGFFTAVEGVYAFFLGPNFEGPYNKKAFYSAGLTCVGMSGLSELAYWSTGGHMRALSLGFVTNDEGGHSHEDNVAIAKRAAPALGVVLHKIIADMPMD